MAIDEKELLRLAEQELIGEAKRAAARYSISGPSGWHPCPLGKTNKTFLVNTLRQTIFSNRLRDVKETKKPTKRKERKLFKGRNSHGFNNDNIVFTSPSKRKCPDSSKDVVKEKKSEATVSKKYDNIKKGKNSNS